MNYNDLFFYEISPLTMAVMGYKDKNGKTCAYTLEEQDTFIIHETPMNIIDNACKFFGSSLRGRQDGTRSVYGITHKAPIAIDPSSGMYFFPTASPANPSCSWLAHSHIDHVERVHEKQSEIIFKNREKILVNVSYGSIINQLQRTAQYRYLLNKRINYLKQHNAEKVSETYPSDPE